MTFAIALHCKTNKYKKYGNVLYNWHNCGNLHFRIPNLCINKARKILIENWYGNK
jgi:hypothetical protein